MNKFLEKLGKIILTKQKSFKYRTKNYYNQ